MCRELEQFKADTNWDVQGAQRNGHPDYSDYFDYPSFRRYSETVADRADLMVAGGVASRQAAIFGSGTEGERYIGSLFPAESI
jgi:hypothetical protein